MSATSTGRHADRFPEGQQAVGGPEPGTAREPEPEVAFDPEPTAVIPAVDRDVDRDGGPAGRSAAPAAAPVQLGDQRQVVTCPECGTTAEVALHRRRADDFCRRCDYPLFWTPSVIVSGDGAREEAGLRRLPGTAGRVTVASRACPHCSESNQLSATTCVRCHGEMDPPPPVQPVQVAPAPEPEPEPAPPQHVPWWVWLGAGVTLALLVAVLVVLLQ